MGGRDKPGHDVMKGGNLSFSNPQPFSAPGVASM
jgi:hypothetical protein